MLLVNGDARPSGWARYGWRLAAVGMLAAAAVAVPVSPAVAAPPYGSVYGWGSNANGDLGIGSIGGERHVPTIAQTPAGVTFTAVAGGYYFGVALATDGSAYTWGDDDNGQLGTGGSGGQTGTPGPVQMPDGVTFTAIDAGSEFAIALGDDGVAYTWGSNNYGQLGIGDGTVTHIDTPRPVQMPGGVTFTAVSAGWVSASAIGNDGVVYTWGDNSEHQGGDGSAGPRDAPKAVTMPDGVSAFTAVATGEWGSLALAPDGTAYSWGDGSSGTLGQGPGVTSSPTPAPVSMPDGVSFTAVSAGWTLALAVADNGTGYSWGDNTAGALGRDISPANASATPGPIDMPPRATFTAISAADDLGAALTSDGDIYVWGRNDVGQYGNDTSGGGGHTPTRANTPAGGRFTAVAAGVSDLHVLALAEPVPDRIAATGGDQQTVRTHRPFPEPLHATVTATDGDSAVRAPVTFTIHSPATFADGTLTATVATDSAGVAISPLLIATGQTGTVTVTAATPDLGSVATFSLTVLAQPAPPAPTATPAPTPTPAPTGTPAPTATPAKGLPHTGSGRSPLLVGGGVALIGAGALLLTGAVAGWRRATRPTRR